MKHVAITFWGYDFLSVKPMPFMDIDELVSRLDNAGLAWGRHDSPWFRVEDRLPDVHRNPATPDEQHQSRAVLVKMPSGLFVAHYDWKQRNWLLSVDNRYGMLFLNYVTHWRELPEGPE